MKSLFLLLSFFIFSLFIFSQKSGDKPLLIINGEEISKDEFLHVFSKNNSNKEKLNREELEEYLDLYINFRLKVAQSLEMKLDTHENFINELAGYRNQLAQPYLTEKNVLENLLNETYQRMKYDVRASHILVKISANAHPKDTLEAYKKAQQIRQKLLRGESFENLSVNLSDDEHAKEQIRPGQKPTQGNKGDLGFFSALNLPYEFENATYNLNVNEISQPVRTGSGYHIIKLTDKRPALWKVQVAHILFTVPADADKAQKDSIEKKTLDMYNKIQQGESFEELAKKYSDDKGSGNRGGILPWFGSFRMLPDFIEPLYEMKKGEVTKPLLTSYGYHIVKLLDRKEAGSFEELENELRNRIIRDQRNNLSKQVLSKKLKDENKCTSDKEAVLELAKQINDSIYTSTWKASFIKDLGKVVFTINETEFLQKDFAKYIEENQNIAETDDIETFVINLFEDYETDMVIEYENKNLKKKYPEFKALMDEYHDGILLFNLTDEKVWSKAIRDTAGLKIFYESVKNNYISTTKIDGVIYFCNDEKTAKEVRKISKKAIKSNENVDYVLSQLNNDDITYKSGELKKEDYEILNKIKLKRGISKVLLSKDDKYVVVQINEVIPSQPKNLTEIKGIITNEYQQHLEKIWINELREKYKWKVEQDVFESIFK